MNKYLILALAAPSFIIGSQLFGAEELRVADLAKDLAKVSGKAVVADRSSMQTTQNLTADERKNQNALVEAIRSAGMEVVEYDGVVRVVRSQDAERAKKELASGVNNAICKGTSKINTDFPEPTDIKDITRAYSLWLGQPLVIDRTVNGKVQIHHDKKVLKQDGCKIWIAALNQIGLEILERDGVAVILPMRMKNRWQWPGTSSNSLSGLADFDFTEFSSVQAVVTKYNAITGSNITIADQTDGKVSIVGAEKIEKSKVPFLFTVAINKIGLKVQGNKIVR